MDFDRLFAEFQEKVTKARAGLAQLARETDNPTASAQLTALGRAIDEVAPQIVAEVPPVIAGFKTEAARLEKVAAEQEAEIAAVEQRLAAIQKAPRPTPPAPPAPPAEKPVDHELMRTVWQEVLDQFGPGAPLAPPPAQAAEDVWEMKSEDWKVSYSPDRSASASRVEPVAPDVGGPTAKEEVGDLQSRDWRPDDSDERSSP
jgi:hypothetical protein